MTIADTILNPGDYLVELAFSRPCDPEVLRRALLAMGWSDVVFDEASAPKTGANINFSFSPLAPKAPLTTLVIPPKVTAPFTAKAPTTVSSTASSTVVKPQAEPPICVAARAAIARNSPAAAGLVAQCKALGFDISYTAPYIPKPGEKPVMLPSGGMSNDPVRAVARVTPPKPGVQIAPLPSKGGAAAPPVDSGVRVNLANAGMASEDAPAKAFRASLPDAATQRGFDIGWGLLRGPKNPWSGSPDTVRNTLANDGTAGGFDIALRYIGSGGKMDGEGLPAGESPPAGPAGSATPPTGPDDWSKGAEAGPVGPLPGLDGSAPAAPPSGGGAGGGGGGGGGASAHADADAASPTDDAPPPAPPEWNQPPAQTEQATPSGDVRTTATDPSAGPLSPATPATTPDPAFSDLPPGDPLGVLVNALMQLTPGSPPPTQPLPNETETIRSLRVANMWRRWKEWGSPFSSAPGAGVDASVMASVRVAGTEAEDDTLLRFVGRLTHPIRLVDPPGMQWIMAKRLHVRYDDDIRLNVQPHPLDPGRFYEFRILSRDKSAPTREDVKKRLGAMGFAPMKLTLLKRNIRLPNRPSSLSMWYGMGQWLHPSTVVTVEDTFYFEQVQEATPS